MTRNKVGTAIAVAALALAGAGTAYADAHNQSCQTIEAGGGGTPGHAATSPGSPFNEPGVNSASGGTGGQNYSPSAQYDVACQHTTNNGTANVAPQPTTPVTNTITNNAVSSRPTNTSGPGKGSSK
jgi:hypothetical protein